MFGREYFWPIIFIYWLLFTVPSTVPFAIAQKLVRRFCLCSSISAYMGLLVDKVTLPRVFPRIVGPYPVSTTISSPTLILYDSSNGQCRLLTQKFIYLPSSLLSKTETAIVNTWWCYDLNSNYCPGRRGVKFVAPCKAFMNVRCTEPGIEKLNTRIISMWP